MNSLHHVQPGQAVKPSASTHNAFVDAALAHQRDQQGENRRSRNDHHTFYIKNITSSDAPRFGVLGIDGPIITEVDSPDEYKRRVTFKGVEPSLADHQSRFVILAEPIAAGEIGQGYAAGVCIANVDIQTEGDAWAGITDADATRLTSGIGPAEIISAPPGTGEKLCVVRLGSTPSPILAKITEVDAINGELSAVEVLRDGDTHPAPRTWDGGAAPNLPKIKVPNTLDLPRIDDIIEVFHGPDDSGDRVWSAIGRSQPVLGKVLSVDQTNHQITVQDINPDGTARTDGRSFGSVRVLASKLPVVGEFVTLDYGYVGASVEWYVVGDQGDNILARVTASATGSATWVEVSIETHADLVDGRTGTAKLPHGWQEMPADTIIEIMPGSNSSYSVVGVVRGLDGESNGHDQRIEARNAGGTNWGVDDQGNTAGLQGIAAGNIYRFNPRGLAIDLYDTVYTSEGQLQASNYRESVRITGDVDPSTRLIGHVGMWKTADDYNDDTWLLFLGPPKTETIYTHTINIAAGSNMTGGGQITLTFDDGGRYNGGEVTQTITLNADTQGGGGDPGTHTSITATDPITASGSAGGVYTIGLAPPGPASTNVDLSAQGDPSYLVALTGHGTMQFDSDGRYVGGGATDQLFVEQIDIDVVTGVSFSAENGLEVTKKSITVVARDNGDNTETVVEATEC